MGVGEAKSSFQAPRALAALATPTLLVTSTLTKCRQFGNCCSRLFFSRMYCRKEMKSCRHRVTGLSEMGNRNSFQTSCPTFSPLPKPKTTHPEVIASEATEGQGQKKRGRERDRRHHISLSPIPEGPCEHLSQVTSSPSSELSPSDIPFRAENHIPQVPQELLLCLSAPSPPSPLAHSAPATGTS